MRTTAIGFLTFAAFLLGCADSGPPRAAISGTVKLNGQLVEEGSITFIPVEGTTGPGVGAIIKNGQYHIPQARGVIVGRNRVELRSIQKTGEKIQSATGKQGVLVEELGEAFPPEYNAKSTLVREITPEANTLDFDIRVKKSGG